MNELMSPHAFKWFVTLLVGVTAVIWIVFELLRLSRLAKADKRDPLVRDKIFGYFVGMMVAGIGLYGCLLFHDVI